VGPGDVVAVMLPKGPATMECAVALARLGAVYQPLFTAFQPEGIRQRIVPSSAKVVITDSANRPKLKEILNENQSVICMVNENDNLDQWEGDLGYQEAMSLFDPLPEKDHYFDRSNASEQPLALLYSSGTTGPPKGILCPAKALENFRIYLEQGIGLRPNNEDRYWNIADAGWAYGLYYNVFGPLYIGQTAHMLSSGFTPESTLAFLAAHNITSFAAAPTVYRALRPTSEATLQEYAGEINLRAASSAGEPLPPAVSEWFEQRFGVPILNHYGQTENGMMVNQHRAGKRKIAEEEAGDPTSCGIPMEGFDGACLLDEDANVIDEPEKEGELCMKVSDCPLFWFAGYHQSDKPLTDANGYYHTGDRARIVVDGNNRSFVFSSRNDDIINTSGYRVGPAEIEGSIMQLDFVLEVAVVGVPDDLRGETIKAYAVVRPGSRFDGDHHEAAAEGEIQDHVKKNLAKHLVPKTVSFVSRLPKTDSGKIKRFLLRQGLLD
jgi:acetyl-CoA synthetase